MIAALKFLHIAALSIWCAGLVGLPLLLARHDPSDDQHRYSRRRIATHVAYVGVVTPAAVIAIGLGTALIFLRDVFVPWMFVKVALVGLLVLAHAWLGHLTLQVGERQGAYAVPHPAPLLLISGLTMLVILILVLGKPFVDDRIVPAWMLAPQGQRLPVDEVPRW
ncbi:CopD family protein [Reyranella sp.]|uniref:CopD family protein n=1 Tax=Reyranella sp. TaxID=1929291 RepID=UPI0040350D62